MIEYNTDAFKQFYVYIVFLEDAISVLPGRRDGTCKRRHRHSGRHNLILYGFADMHSARETGQGQPGIKKAASFLTAYRLEEIILEV